MKFHVIHYDDVKCGMYGRILDLVGMNTILYVRVHMNKNTFYIDSYLLNQIRTSLHWCALLKG